MPPPVPRPTSRAGTYRTSRSVSLDTPRPLCSPSANRACRSSHVPRPWTPFATNTTHVCIAAACSPPRLARAGGLRPADFGRSPPPPYSSYNRHSSVVLTTTARLTHRLQASSRAFCALLPRLLESGILKKFRLLGQGLFGGFGGGVGFELVACGREIRQGQGGRGMLLHPHAARASLLLRFLWSRLRADGSAPSQAPCAS
ncbi:hypothetical protein C8J57DRAFT_247867 [Mycena rebaudengoi]|nr:hypothetical protein C8J57DRAFT_247867 [Mycena rebaudengoi]